MESLVVTYCDTGEHEVGISYKSLSGAVWCRKHITAHSFRKIGGGA